MICSQSVSAYAAASAWTAAIAACSWWADLPARQHRGDQPGPLLDLPGVPPGPVLLGERHQVAVAVGARVAAGVGQQHQRQQPGRLVVGATGRGLGRASIRVSRIASPATDTSVSCSPAVAAYPSLKAR